MKRISLFLLALCASSVDAQLVPEGIHKDANGPMTMCGITSDDALDFEKKVRADRQYRQEEAGNRFVLFVSSDENRQWVLATKKNAAYPLATCRELREENGSLYMSRNMRCDGTRDQCDRAFIEFNALDEQVKKALAGNDPK